MCYIKNMTPARLGQRKQVFDSYRDHAWLKRIFLRLSKSDLGIAYRFIEANDGLDKGAFELAINRMFLDKERPKNFSIILELLTCSNSAL